MLCPVQKADHNTRCSICTNIFTHDNAGLCQKINAAAIDTRVWITHRNNNPRNSCCDQRLGTRRGLPDMCAGFKCDIGTAAPRRIPRHRKRGCFGVRTAATRGMANRHQPAVLIDDGAPDRWIGRGTPFGPLCRCNGNTHPARILMLIK